MARRILGVGALVLALAAGTALAAAPAGPRLSVVKLSAKKGFELLNVNRKGGDPLRLAGGNPRKLPTLEFFSPTSWSPDGQRVAYSAIVGFREGDDGEPIRRVFTVGADGTGRRVVPGSNGAIGPVFSPDGQSLAFTRLIDRETPSRVGGKQWREFHGSSIWIVEIATGKLRQLTPWRDEVRYAASSFSPDGLTLSATHEDPLLNEAEPVALAVDGSGSRRLLDDGQYPVFSPDGSKVALVRRIEEYGRDRGEDLDLFVLNSDGSGLRRLTHTPGRAELFPSWDPSGERLAYVRFSAAETEGAAFGVGGALMQINADGTCPTKVKASPRTAYYAPAWQPGPGRGAGGIEC